MFLVAAANASRWVDRSKMEYLITAKYPEGFPPISDLIREHEVGERVQELVRQGYLYISLESAPSAKVRNAAAESITP